MHTSENYANSGMQHPVKIIMSDTAVKAQALMAKQEKFRLQNPAFVILGKLPNFSEIVFNRNSITTFQTFVSRIMYKKE